MSERTTGATDAQIDAAARRWYARAFHVEDGSWGDVTDRDKAIWCGVMQTSATDLVPPGMVIAPAADVLKPYHVSVDIDDLRLVLGNQTVYSADDDDLHQAICRLEAIADGGAV